MGIWLLHGEQSPRIHAQHGRRGYQSAHRASSIRSRSAKERATKPRYIRWLPFAHGYACYAGYMSFRSYVRVSPRRTICLIEYVIAHIRIRIQYRQYTQKARPAAKFNSILRRQDNNAEPAFAWLRLQALSRMGITAFGSISIASVRPAGIHQLWRDTMDLIIIEDDCAHTPGYSDYLTERSHIYSRWSIVVGLYLDWNEGVFRITLSSLKKC